MVYLRQRLVRLRQAFTLVRSGGRVISTKEWHKNSQKSLEKLLLSTFAVLDTETFTTKRPWHRLIENMGNGNVPGAEILSNAKNYMETMYRLAYSLKQDLLTGIPTWNAFSSEKYNPSANINVMLKKLNRKTK